MTKRSVTVKMPVGNWKLIQSNGAVTVDLNLDRIDSDTIEWLFEKGLQLAIRNAYASIKDPAERQIEAQRKADEICDNVRNAGKSSGWTKLESLMIKAYIVKVHNGQMPQGGMARVSNEISQLPLEVQAKLRNAAQATLDLEF